MISSEAERVMESLRKGIPPDGYVRYFTVGRQSEITLLTDRLRRGQSGALLLKANYGAGKTHLLRFIREVALEEKYAVSSVTLDAKSAVRFNRMDQILGAVWRGLEIPDAPGLKGVYPFLDFIHQQLEASKAEISNRNFWRELTNNWRWDFSETLESPAMFIAVRAWSSGKLEVHNRIEGWLLQPWDYYSQRKLLYQELVNNLRSHFRDPRPEWQFYDGSEGIFNFQLQSYAQSWAALRDMHTLCCAAGLKGLVLLFDEFEDVIYNLQRVNHQESAFWNLFQFYSGKHFKGPSFFAVTPSFVDKCKKLLLSKNRWDYDYSRFDELPTFEMSPLTIVELEDVALKIMDVHGVAYRWDPRSIPQSSKIKSVIEQAANIQVQDRTRNAIKEAVKFLDNTFEDNNE